MATRSIIAMCVSNADLNTTAIFNQGDMQLEKWVQLEKWGNEEVSPSTEKVKITGKLMQIYAHWDGYPTYMGYNLLKNFNSYAEVFNLLLGGHISSLDENGKVKYYHNRKGEKWEYIKPTFVSKTKDLMYECFTYLFYNGKWYVSAYNTNKFYPLEKILELDDPDNFEETPMDEKPYIKT